MLQILDDWTHDIIVFLFPVKYQWVHSISKKSDQPPFIRLWVLLFISTAIKKVLANNISNWKAASMLANTGKLHMFFFFFFGFDVQWTRVLYNKVTIMQRVQTSKCTPYLWQFNTNQLSEPNFNPLSLSIKTSYHCKGWHQDRPHNQSGCWTKRSIYENINDTN